MSKISVANNKIVSLTYVLRDEQGKIVEYSDLPIAYLHGSGRELFAKIEQSLLGRTVGERISVKLSPSEAFGEHDPDLTYTDDLDNVPPELRRVGQEFEAENSKGETRRFVVSHIHDGKLTVDANHPLAGRNVVFDVTIQDIRDATAQELSDGQPSSRFTPPVQ